MVSDMESTHPIPPTGDELRDVERAAAAPFVDYPELPRWWVIVAGLWFTAVLAPSVTEWPDNTALRISILVVLVAALGAAVTWYTSQRGVVPSTDPRHAPPEVGRVMWAYYALAAAAFGVMLALWAWAPPLVTLAWVFGVSTGGLAIYDRRYERAANRAKARLA